MTTRRLKATWLAAGAIAMLAVPAQAGVTGYIKIPDIDGESADKKAPKPRKDSGDAHLDYLKISLSQSDGVETEDIGFKANDGDAEATGDHSAGDEHEIEYDVSAGAFKARDIPGVTWGDTRPVARVSQGQRSVVRTRTRSTSIPATATSKPTRQARVSRDGVSRDRADRGRPGNASVEAFWAQCEVGARYPHILLGDGEGREYRLERVQVAECGREHVSFNYQKVSGG